MATTRTDDAIVHNETSRDNNNMIAPSGTAESFLFASMQHNAEMIKAFTNTFVTLQKQLCPIPTEIISDKKRKNTFKYFAAKTWNDLPDHFRKETSFLQFKNLINSWNGSSCHCSACAS